MKKNLLMTMVLVFILILVFNSDVLVHLNPDYLRTAIEQAGIWGPAFFVLAYILATILFLPGTPLTLMAGVLFGPILGALYVLVGANIGASLAFLLSRTILHEFAQKQLGKFQNFKKYNIAIKEKGFETVLFLRLVPLFPFNALNYILGLSTIRFRHYLAATLIGMVPGILAYVYFGDVLVELDFANAFLATALFILLILFSFIYKRSVKIGKQEKGRLER